MSKKRNELFPDATRGTGESANHDVGPRQVVT
jgi:hypothetical protein